MIPAGVEIFVALAPIDLRFGFDRLAGLVQAQLGQVARSGALFVFFGKRGRAAGRGGLKSWSSLAERDRRATRALHGSVKRILRKWSVCPRALDEQRSKTGVSGFGDVPALLLLS
jgi:hypothetical protein